MIIMDMLNIPKLQLLATAGMDSKLILWDTASNRLKHIYK
jgi:hypothetical protein